MAFKLADFVKETTTSTGTGSIALAGAATGYQAFSAKMTIGDTTTYSIRAVDGTGAPTGEWELVGGTYTSVNTLSRDTVLSSSNSDASVSFSAGTKEVYITMPSMRAAWIRERLTADRTYYVRTDGSDSNTGLVNTSGGALLTIQAAVLKAAALDLNGYTVVIQVGDGTYAAGVTDFVSPVGSGTVVLRGNTTTPASCLISVTSGNCVYVSGRSQAARKIEGFKVVSSAGSGLVVNDGASLWHSNMDFGACASYHIYASSTGACYAYGNYTISGSATVHLFCTYTGHINISARTVTLTGTPAWGVGFAISRQSSSIIAYAMTFSGSSTGPRFEVSSNGVIYTNGGGASYLPGSTAGVTLTGGQQG